MQRYVIIGSGTAGVAAAQTIREHDRSGSIQIVTDEQNGYYSRPGLAFYLTGEVSEEGLYPLDERDFRDSGIQFIQDRVTAIDPVGHQLLLQRHGWLGYDRLLVATGSQATLPKIPGIDLQGAVKLDTLTDARQILATARKAHEGVVVGGGITALELVEGLAACRVKVHYLLRGDRFWSNVLDETESMIIEQRLANEGVQIHKRTELQEIRGSRGRVEGVITREGVQMKAQIVAVAIGIQPRTQLASAAGINVQRGILVDERMQTSAPDIFAAGDAAQVYDPFSGKYLLESLWGPARDQGRVAGRNMVGLACQYLKPIAFNVTRLCGLTTTIIGSVGCGEDADLVGIAHGDSEVWRQIPGGLVAGHRCEINRVRLMLGQRTILGAVVIGDQTLSRPLEDLVRNQVDTSAIHPALLMPDASIGDILVDFWISRKDQDAPKVL